LARIKIKIEGKNTTPIVLRAAPKNPDILYPIKVALFIAIGPGVI
jgi:hypothetical protein